ncbi:uncharacterized protein LOC130285438 [Hyla sarda]|uniref:uncharacterized protein LOC130285438 n=1 Tax=Hyla sarda TaxID=327740 RepID=UPI0024C382E0|nr:uncharacterized protein LOC130285438 [Hyla sarda]
MGGGKVRAAKPKKKKVGAGKIRQPTGGPTGRMAGKGQHPAPHAGFGQTSVAPQKENVGAGKSSKPTKSQQPGKDVKPKKAPRTCGGKVRAAKPKKKDKAGKSPKPLKKPTVNAQPTGGPTGCTAGKGQHPAPHAGFGQTSVAPLKENVGAGKSPKPTKSQQPGKDVKPKKVSQPTKKSTVKEQTGETAARKRKREEQNGGSVKPKRTKQQPTGYFPEAIRPPVVAPIVIVHSRQSIPGPSPMTVNRAAPTGRVMMPPQEPFEDRHCAALSGQGTKPRHFVDIHEAALIQRVTLVDPILDDLKQWRLLTQEPYDRVRNLRPSQEQMRELFCYVKSWGKEGKDKLLESLRKHNAPLIGDLEKS